jgi:cytochrome c oxidase cbb3-type subunit IV
MLMDVIRAIDYSDCAEAALLLFVFAFGLLLMATYRLSPEATERFASIPLSDNVEDPRDD